MAEVFKLLRIRWAPMPGVGPTLGTGGSMCHLQGGCAGVVPVEVDKGAPKTVAFCGGSVIGSGGKGTEGGDGHLSGKASPPSMAARLGVGKRETKEGNLMLFLKPHGLVCKGITAEHVDQWRLTRDTWIQTCETGGLSSLTGCCETG